MTSNIIYHDFSGKNTISTMPQQGPTILLTAPLLEKGRRLAKINHTLHVACVALCGVCIGVSGMILWVLFGGLG